MSQGKTVNDAITRTQGCWNCKHWSTDGGKAFWNSRRLADLQVAAQRAANHPQGENETQVLNIRRMTEMVDTGVAKGELGICLKREQSLVGDLVAHAHLCHVWSGRQGASLAREGAKADKLPGELMEDMLAAAPKERSN